MALVPFDDVVEALRAQGYKPRKSGKGFRAHCPGREDRNPSLSVTRAADGSAILKDYGNQRTAKEILAALGFTPAPHVRTPAKSSAQMHTSTHPSSGIPGLTLEQYAQAKKLPVDFLASLGLSDKKFSGTPAIRIPYRDADGVTLATRYRLAMEKGDPDNRFRWSSGSKTNLYGLWRLEDVRKQGYVILVEGESCSQTLWHAGFPALGVPGASNWKATFDDALTGIERVYVIVEPDQAGESFLATLQQRHFKSRLHIVRLDGFKDASALYLADPANFAQRMQSALDGATPWEVYAANERRAQAERAAPGCADLIGCPDIIAKVVQVVRALGMVGEDRAACILFLALTSRLLQRPISVVVKGPSSGGKSFTVETMLKLFPPSCYLLFTATSEKALLYFEESLTHRMVIIYEAAGVQSETASYVTRTLLSEGRIDYATVDKTKDGMKSRRITVEGPAGLITTTTSASLHSENETRLISLPITDTPEQTANVLRELAGKYDRVVPNLEPWHEFQRWLEGSVTEAVVPFAVDLAERLPTHTIRLRRDFSAMLALIETHAILHQGTRERDEAGRVIATLDDYEAIFGLYEDLLATQTEKRVRPGVKAVADAVYTLCMNEPNYTTIAKVASHINRDRSVASRDLKEAEDRGYVKLVEARSKEKRFQPGDPIPPASSVLPAPAALCAELCNCASPSEEVNTTPAREEIVL